MESKEHTRKDQDRVYWARKAFDFVRNIGLPVEEVSSSIAREDAFIPFVTIRDGGLKVCIDSVFPGELLHEAGHLAILPEQFRKIANDSLKEAFAATTHYVLTNPSALVSYPEDPIARACMQCGEAEALAWQFAAAQEIGMPSKWMFTDASLQSGAEDVLFRLQNNQHFGINGLRAAGWTELRKNPHSNIPVYPKLAFWIFPTARA